MNRYRSRKFYEWTSDIAYVAGLMAADGCLINDNRHLNLTSTDEQLIDLLMRILKLHVKVAVKQGGYAGTYA